MIQPGVLAFGKNHNTIFFPKKSVKDTEFPSASDRVKSGALFPILSIFYIPFVFHFYFSVSIQIPSQSLPGEFTLNSSQRDIYILQGVVGRPI